MNANTDYPADVKLTAIIPTAGKGGRMYPFSEGMPKTLLPYKNKPILVHILNYLNNSFFKKIILLCNDEWTDMIRTYVDAFVAEEKRFFEIEYIRAGNNKKNTIVNYIKENIDQFSDPFLLHYCDVACESAVDWEKAIHKYNCETDSALVFISKKFHYTVGLVNVDPASDHINEFIQKPDRIIGENHYANCAISLLSKKFISTYARNDEDIYDRAFSDAARDNKVIPTFDVPRWIHFKDLFSWFQIQSKYKNMEQ